MKIRYKNGLEDYNFQELLFKAVDNIEQYEDFQFKFEKEFADAYMEYLNIVMEAIIDGLALKLEVDPKNIKKSVKFKKETLKKAAEGIIDDEALLMKSFWKKLKDKYTKSVNKFKSFFFNKGKPVEPMPISGDVLYNSETKDFLTDKEWKNIETGIIEFLGDTLGNPEDEIAVKSGLFGLLKQKMDDEGIPLDQQQNMSYEDIKNKFDYDINDTKKVEKEISKDKVMKEAVKYAKNHAAEYLSIKDQGLKDKITNMIRKQIVGGLQDGISAQEMISRLYWIDPTDELGKRFNDDTIQAYNRDLDRIVRTEMSNAINNGYLAANTSQAKKGEKQYFVYSGQYNPKEKANEPCNIYLGKVGLLVDKPQGSEETDDPMADYLIWQGKNNVGRKKAEWWFALPTHPNSFSKDTDFYTNDGWKNASEISERDLFLSLDPETKDLEYVNAKKTIKHKEDYLLRFYNNISDSLVTEDHDMFYQYDKNRKEKNGIFEFEKAKNLFGKKSGRFYAGCEWKGIERKIPDYWYEFFGYYLSDGWTEKRYESIYVIGIAKNKDKKPEKYQKILECLDKLPKTSKNVLQGKDSLRFLNKKLGKYLTKFGKCNAKYIPEFIMNSTPEKIRVFLDAYLMCDGHERKKKSIYGFISHKNKYFTTSKKMADQISELILKVGKRPYIDIQKNKRRVVEFKNGTYTCNYDMYRISENNHTYIDFRKMRYERVKYNDYVYCVELEKYHTLWTRRNGKTVWQGNCTHHWQKIDPKTQQWNPEINKIELKEDLEKSQPVHIDNVDWRKEKIPQVKKSISEVVKKIKSELGLKTPFIVKLYKECKEGKNVRSMHDEGVIIIYENSPDMLGDLIHEIAHNLFYQPHVKPETMQELKKLMKKIKRKKGDGRVFMNPHTFSNEEEVFATIFKWYVLGKVKSNSYMEILQNYVPGGKELVEKIVYSNELKKSDEVPPKTIAWDFDKVISTYNGWKGQTVFGNPIKKNIALMKKYKDRGYRTIIFTSRKVTPELKSWLNDNNVYYDEIIGDKPYYNAFIDDRTVNNLIVNNLENNIENVLSKNNELIKSIDYNLLKNDKTKMKMSYHGIPINIEWKKGEIRTYPGSPYKNQMIDWHYGYIRNTISPDGEDVDVYVKDDPDQNAKIYMINQLHRGDEYDGEFDEHKFMIGFKSQKDAIDAYKKTMQNNMFGGVSVLSVENFKKNFMPFFRGDYNE